MAAEDSAAGEAGLCVCTVSKDEMMAGVMYNRSVPLLLSIRSTARALSSLHQCVAFVAGTGYAVRAWAERSVSSRSLSGRP